MKVCVSLLLGACGLLAAPAFAAELIVDGGFEQPAVTTPNQFQGGYVAYASGQSFGGPTNNAWTVIGSGNNIALTSNTEYTGSASNPTFYNAHSGGQSVDLTGTADNGARVGIAQTVATTAGATYALSFWVGSFVDTPTTLELDIDGALAGYFTNPLGGSSPGQGVNYQQFTAPITARGAATTISFLYSGGRSDASLDDVSLTSTTAAVPEPATWGMMLAGFGGIGYAMRGRRKGAVRFS